MFKVISAFCLLLAVAKGWEFTTTTTVLPPDLYVKRENRTDLFVDIYKTQFYREISNFDTQLKNFQQVLHLSVLNINNNDRPTNRVLHQTNEYLNALAFRSEADKQYVSSYRDSIPSAVEVAGNINKCAYNFQQKLENVLEPARKIRDELEAYYKEAFNTRIPACDSSNDEYSCITLVIHQTEEFTTEKRRDFEEAMKAAECILKAGSTRATQCVFDVQSNLSKNTLKPLEFINRITGSDYNCKPCRFHCPTVSENVDSQELEVHNPFYDNPNAKCALLKDDYRGQY